MSSSKKKKKKKAVQTPPVVTCNDSSAATGGGTAIHVLPSIWQSRGFFFFKALELALSSNAYKDIVQLKEQIFEI